MALKVESEDLDKSSFFNSTRVFRFALTIECDHKLYLLTYYLQLQYKDDAKTVWVNRIRQW